MPSETQATPTSEYIKDTTSRITALVEALEASPSMNRQNPKASPKSLFWVWDFTQRTQQNLKQISVPALLAGDSEARNQWQDIMGRNFMSEQMICSDKGKMMLQTMCQGEQPEDFSEVVKEKARALTS